jgi:hypothetical protein
MNTIKKLVAGLLLCIGLAILLLGTIDLVSSSTDSEDKEGALAALVIFGLPSLLLGSWLIWDLNNRNRLSLREVEKRKEQAFLQLLNQKGEEVTVIKFALYAQISIEEAQSYLDLKAKQLDAEFQAGDEGGIIYKFPQ